MSSSQEGEGRRLGATDAVRRLSAARLTQQQEGWVAALTWQPGGAEAAFQPERPIHTAAGPSDEGVERCGGCELTAAVISRENT